MARNDQITGRSAAARVALFVTAGLAAAPATGREAGDAAVACELDLDLPTEDVDACPAVFGVAADREANRARREELLEVVEPGTYCIDVVHAASWGEPERLEYGDALLVATFTEQGCAPTALVQLEPAHEAEGCAAGLYLVQVDDALGEDGRVLAILDGILLVETGEALRYLETVDAGRPVWRMVWHPPWRLRAPRGPARPTPPARSSRSRRR